MAKQEERFTQVPNLILDNNSLSVYEFRILMHIARQTIGYNKKSDGISLTQFVKFTGMGKSKVVTTIAALKKKRLIKITKQTQPSGRKSFNKYTLTLVHEKDIPPSLIVHETDSTSPRDGHTLVHEMDIQNTIEQNTIDKRRETERSDNIFFSLDENEQRKEVNTFADDLSMSASNPRAYKVKIKKQIDKQHKETLEEFESWYLDKSIVELTKQYVGQSIGRHEIESIYSYSDTKGYDSSLKFLVQSIDADDRKEIRAYSSKQALEVDMQNGLSIGAVVG